ncbi:4-hydroxy-3-methylbut-2-enyl diphosphate reductase [Fretibacterium sp. OH1220_COT-178]|uniref:4-hydroxy-3-methylbut-2-enyl diphosphate reductase n=1 Tax=Fretibacterium sp. OH1220_COT-178 TaxID=2491047 RepID=UPI001F48375D|nr:4-hydroxy-3-methylbut-2-enyl diphosphate reductase [Fretibacterium sp. OH1220_COT-178]
MKQIVMAERAGFCFGVKRAVDAILEALTGNPEREVWTIGMPIHNPQEVARLKNMGLRVAEEVSEVPPGVKVLIRAHGESRAVLRELREKNVCVIDTTCPFVRRAQDLANSLSDEGYHIVLLGDRNHPEIRSIMGYVDGGLDVVVDEAEAMLLPKRGRVALISQTTQQEERLAAVAAILVRRAGELRVCNTICRATMERQDAVRALVGRVDGVVLIGGRESANTGKLRNIAEMSGLDVLWIESTEELDRGWFEGRERIGIAAGASTPEWLITEISNKIARM